MAQTFIPADGSIVTIISQHNSPFAAESGLQARRTMSLNAAIHRTRDACALRLFARLQLRPGTKILDVANGSCSLALTLAAQAYEVISIHRTRALLELGQERAALLGTGRNISFRLWDMSRIPLPDASVDAVLAIGVLSWMRFPEETMSEMLRVLRPGGVFIASVDNRWRLSHVLDPRLTPLLSPVRRAALSLLERMGVRSPGFKPSWPRTSSIHDFDDQLKAAGVRKIAGTTAAFGPFTFLGKRIFNEHIGKRINQVLQRAADRRAPILRSVGSHYLAAGTWLPRGAAQAGRRDGVCRISAEAFERSSPMEGRSI